MFAVPALLFPFVCCCRLHFTQLVRVSDAVRDAALKHRVVFLASAMNAGPALSTVQAPGGTTPGLIGVGAFA